MSFTASSNSHLLDNHHTRKIGENKYLHIFLGGSCNPTTWRQNVAIPYLETNGISYYNPQVDDWTPEIVEIERHAKQNAKILLFVIDKQTRSTVSLVESAYMAGENSNLVLVIYPFDFDILSLTDTTKQTTSCFETRSKSVRANIPSISTEDKTIMYPIAPATLISSTSSSSSTNTHNLNLTSTIAASSTQAAINSAITSQLDSCELNQSLESVCEEFKHVSGTIKMNGEPISLGEFYELMQARCILQNLVMTKKIPLFTDILQALRYVSSNLRNNVGVTGSPNTLTSNSTNDNAPSLNPNDSNIFESYTRAQPTQNYLKRDVYLSLCSDDCTSLESTVIPILEKKGLTYNYKSVNTFRKACTMTNTSIHRNNSPLDPQVFEEKNNLLTYPNANDLFENTRLAVEEETCAIRGSRVLLFVITNRCRGLSVMVLASHFMALFRDNVVLCVQYLEEPCSIGGETLTKTAIADYNRGRVYLCDYAVKSRVPVFSTVQEAIECCSRKCHHECKE